MDSAAAITARIETLQRQLEISERTLERFGDLEPRLYNRVRIALRAELEARGRDLRTFTESVAGGEAERLTERWDRLQELGDRCREALSESLAFFYGALSRASTLDSDICRAADALLDGFSRETGIEWNRLTVLAEEEFLGQAAQIIRLRFADATIWTLPVAAHEFGHFVARELRSSVREGDFSGSELRFGERLRREYREVPKRGAHLDEYFADMFATYTLGPAYACTCLFLRFEPSTGDSWTHPCPAARAYVILQTLRRMRQDTEPYGGYRDSIERLHSDWSGLLADAGEPADLASEQADQLDAIASEIYPLLQDGVMAIRFGGLNPARRMVGQLCSLVRPPVAPEGSIPDLLNAAWMCRRDNPGNGRLIAGVAAATLSACLSGIGQER